MIAWIYICFISLEKEFYVFYYKDKYPCCCLVISVVSISIMDSWYGSTADTGIFWQLPDISICVARGLSGTNYCGYRKGQDIVWEAYFFLNVDSASCPL